MKRGLVFVVLVSILTIFNTSAADQSNGHLRPHRVASQDTQCSSHCMINNETCIIAFSPMDSACNSIGGLFINSSGQQQSSAPHRFAHGSRSAADLMMPRTPLRLWSLAFLCAASQSQGVMWRPAIGLILALGLPQTEAGAAPSKFPANAQISATTNVPPNTSSQALSNAPSTNDGVQYSSKAAHSDVAVTSILAITASNLNGTHAMPPGTSSRYKRMQSEASQVEYDFNQRRSGSSHCISMLVRHVLPDCAHMLTHSAS